MWFGLDLPGGLRPPFPSSHDLLGLRNGCRSGNFSFCGNPSVPWLPQKRQKKLPKKWTNRKLWRIIFYTGLERPCFPRSSGFLVIFMSVSSVLSSPAAAAAVLSGAAAFPFVSAGSVASASISSASDLDFVVSVCGSSVSVVVLDLTSGLPAFWWSAPSVSILGFSSVFAFSVLWCDDDFDASFLGSWSDLASFLSSVS